MNASSLYSRSVFTAALILAVSCGARNESGSASTGAARRDRPLTIKGSDTMVILGQRLAEEYMKNNPGVVVQVTGGGSGTGVAALINGTTDIAQSSRPMTKEEKTKAQQSRGAAIVETPVALDSLAVFVNQANPIKELTIAQVADIYMGKIKNWRQVGGPNATIVLYGRENSSGTYDYFREHVLKKADFSPSVQTLQGTAAVINAVANDRNGIGYGGIAYSKDVRALAIKNDASAPGVPPNEATVADGSYPLARRLFFYYPANVPERVTNFVQWALTPEAQSFVADVGYFPLSTTRQASDTTATPASSGTGAR